MTGAMLRFVMVEKPTVELGTSTTAEELFEPICELYDAVFSVPPHYWKPDESEQHRRRLRDLMARPTFGIAVATLHGELVGFAYGSQLSPETKWWEGFITPVSKDITTEWPGRTFALIDLAVENDWRGQGLGRKLHDTLLGSRDEERATLASQPSSTGVQAMYERWGWRNVGRLEGAPTDSAPQFDIFVKPLR